MANITWKRHGGDGSGRTHGHEPALPDLTRLRPKRHLVLRLMFDTGWRRYSILALAICVVALVLAVVGLWLLGLERRFRLEARTTTAVVTDRWTTRVYYRFQTEDGRQCKGDSGVPAESRARVGDRLAVEYAASDPGWNRPADSGPHDDHVAALVLAGIFGAIGLTLMLGPLWHARKVAFLLKHGAVARGTIFEKPEREEAFGSSTGAGYVEGTIDSQRTSFFTARYWFATPDGAAHAGKDAVAGLSYFESREAGAAIVVLYLPSNPRRSAIWRSHWRTHLSGPT